MPSEKSDQDVPARTSDEPSEIPDPLSTQTVEVTAKGEKLQAVDDRRIGPYRVLREIGRGGMGAVYLAVRDDDQYRKRVAIKLLRRGMDSEDILRRFRNERQILASLDHPHVARLFDGGTTADGLPYFVMEYVEGKPIDQYCDEHKLSITERLKLFGQVCSAVHFAHRNLIVHRDIKPKNILVTADGSSKLLDFGIAKLLNPELGAQTIDATRIEERLMTPEYASPEQVRGEPVTTASDVYSLGVLLYELLTGHRPYRLESRAFHDITRIICEQEPTRPSTVIANSADVGIPGFSGQITPELVGRLREGSPEKLRRRLSGDLDNIVLMAMRKEPERRYASVAGLSEDIQRHLEGLPVTARRSTLAYRTQKFVRRHWVGVAAGFLVALSLVVGAAVAVWQARVASEQRDQARIAAAKAEQINAFVQEMLSSADPYETGEGRELTVAKVLDRAAARVGLDLAGQPEVEAAVRGTIGAAYTGLGLYEAADVQLRSSLATLEETLGPEHPDVAVARAQLGTLLASKGDYAAAEPLYQDALRVLRRSHGSEHPDVAKVLNQLAQLWNQKGDFAAAETAHRESLAVRRTLHGDQHRSVAQSLNDLAVVLGTKGDYAEAEALHREAIEILRRIQGPEGPDVAQALGTLAFALEQQEKYQEAGEIYHQALVLRRKLFGSEHPAAAWTTYNYADFLYQRGEYQEPVRLCREVLALRGRTLPDTHPLVAASLIVLGNSLTRLGDPVSAEIQIRESLRLRRQTLPADHWLIASAESALGNCLTEQRRFAEAEGLLLNSYQALDSQLGAQHPGTVAALERLIHLYESWNRPEALERYRSLLSRSQ